MLMEAMQKDASGRKDLPALVADTSFVGQASSLHPHEMPPRGLHPEPETLNPRCGGGCAVAMPLRPPLR